MRYIRTVLKKALSVFAASLLITSVTGCSLNTEKNKSDDSKPVADSEPVVIRMADMLAYGTAESSYAKHTGILDEYFKDYNVEFEISSFVNGPAENEAFAAGQLDFATMGNVPAVSGVVNDYGYKIIGIKSMAHTGLFLVQKDSDINSLSVLKGKTVGTTIGGQPHFYLGLALKQVGLSINDINIINTGAETATALRNDDVDACLQGASQVQQLLDEGTARVLVDLQEEYGFTAPAIICASTAAFHIR